MAINAAKRRSLPADKFALPKLKKYPLDTKARVKSAEGYLEKEHNAGIVSDADYASAKKKIAAAAKRFGIQSKYNLDLGVSDVHVPSAGRFKAGKTPTTMAAAASASAVLCGIPLDRNAPDATGVVKDSIFTPGTPARLKWIQLAAVGQWAGHPAGAFQLSTTEFAQICANFYATKNQLAPIDWAHASEMNPTEGNLAEVGAPAWGWIRSMDNRGEGGLWGLVEWKPDVAGKIAAGEFQFFSPAIRFNAKDRVTGANIGARLSSGAVTNLPFIDGLKRIAASDAIGADMNEKTVTLAQRSMPVGKSHEFMAKCRDCLNLDDTATADQMKAKVANLRGLYSDAADAGGDAHAMCQGVNLSAYTTALTEMMGAPISMDIGDLLDAVEEMIDAAMAQHIAEYHAGQAPVAAATLDDEGDDDAGGADMRAASDNQRATNGTTKEAAMADAETTKKLTDLEGEKTVWMTERTTLLTERDAAVAKATKLELELQKATTSLEAKDGELKIMSDKEAARVAADREARVDEAFGTYKDQQKLTDAHRKQMVSFLLSDPAGFEELYPKIAPNERHLLHRIAGDGSKPKIEDGVDGAASPVFSMSDLADQLIRQGWDIERAQLEADRRFRLLQPSR